MQKKLMYYVLHFSKSRGPVLLVIKCSCQSAPRKGHAERVPLLCVRMCGAVRCTICNGILFYVDSCGREWVKLLRHLSSKSTLFKCTRVIQ